jgi:hypothetical protein
MPSVGNLECTRRAASRSTGVNAIAVTANNLGSRMVGEPTDDGIRRWIFQQVDHAVSIGIHQDRAVAASTTKRKFVDPEHPWRLDCPLWDCPHHAQQRRAARGHRQTLAMPTPWSAAEGETDRFEHRPEPERSVGVPLRQDGCLFDEGLARALWLVAPKPADP